MRSLSALLRAARARLFPATLTLIALGLGLFGLADKGLWVDEAVSLRFALSAPQSWFHDNNMALFYALLSAVVALFGDGERALRGLSVACFAASVPLFHALVRRASDERAARIGSVLFVANAYLLHFAQEARGYMLAVLLVIAASYALLRLSQEGRLCWAVSYGLAVGLALYAHAFVLWLLWAHGLCALLLLRHDPRWFRKFALAFTLAAGFAAPLVVRAITAGMAQISWLARPTLDSCLALFVLFAGGSPWLAALYGLLFLAFAATCVQRLCRAPIAESFGQLMFLAWFAFPVATTLILSRLFTPLVHPKYLLITLPALLAGVAVLLARLPTRIQLLAVPALVLLSAAGDYDWYRRYEKEQWREAVAYLDAHFRATDALVLDLRAPEAFDYYVLHDERAGGPRLPAPLIPDRPFSILWGEEQTHSESENLVRIAAAERIWLVRNRSHDAVLRAQILRSHRPASSLALEPHDGDERSLFANAQGRIIDIESFVRSSAAASPY